MVSTELVRAVDRVDPAWSVTLGRSISGALLVLEGPDVYRKFYLRQEDLWPLAVQLERLAKQADDEDDEDDDRPE